MNNETEELLKQMSLQSPSPDMDRRVERELATGSPVPVTARVPWHVATAACAACMLLGLGLGRISRDPAGSPIGSLPSGATLPGEHSADPSSREDLAHLRRTKVSPGSFVLINGTYPARRYNATTFEGDQKELPPRGAGPSKHRTLITLSHGI